MDPYQGEEEKRKAVLKSCSFPSIGNSPSFTVTRLERSKKELSAAVANKTERRPSKLVHVRPRNAGVQ